ncbi:MAG: ABC transporter substrate-binding protein [Bacilli bacterium]|nr:ABC transporter substrate-binding protein [Bacilli bacterium]
MKKLFSLLVVLLLVCSVVGCKEKEAETIKLGSSGPLSGSVSIYGLAVKEGVELAVEEINAAGGVDVDGKMMKLELVDFVNDEADAKKAAAALTSLISKDVDVVVGAVTSGATEGLIAEAVKHGVPVITPTGTADKLTVGDNGDERDVRYNVFRACFYDSYQGKFMGQYAADQGVKKAYVLYNNDEDYSKGLKDAFVETATANNVNVVTAAYSKQDKDFNAFWVPILEGGYDCVYVPDYYENVYNILKTGYAKGYEGVCYGGDGWDGVIKQVKEGEDASFLENCFYTNHYFGESESPAVKTFVEKYQAKYGSIPVSFAALGYDAVYIAKQAIEACDSLEYDAVVEALTTGTFSGLVTSSTPFTFNNGNPEKAAVVITFKDGKEVEAE